MATKRIEELGEEIIKTFQALILAAQKDEYSPERAGKWAQALTQYLEATRLLREAGII